MPIDFKQMAEDERLIKLHVDQIKRVYMENKDAMTTVLSDYISRMDVEPKILKGIIKALANYGWEKNFR